ncbi:hypothetical protein OAA09_01385 [bacterium]|nr:hypothetical protein [bacterium]
MKVGDLVRTKQAHSAYGYDRPVCVVIEAKIRLDGTYLKVIDSEGKTKRWWPYELELVNASR